MFYDNETKKVRLDVSELVFVACRKRERFRRIDNSLKDDSGFAESVIKREADKSGKAYYTDVSLSCSLSFCGTDLEIYGKTSVLVDEHGYTVDIVKSLRYPIKLVTESFIEDWQSEVRCYAYILAKKRGLENVFVRVSVFHTETLERKTFTYSYSLKELEDFFRNVLASFSPFFGISNSHVENRNRVNSTAGFPYPVARDGQREVSKEIYNALKNRHNAIISAPTGIGKTASTLYPALRAQAKGIVNRVFYLTAKNSGNISALDTVDRFLSMGYDITVSVISAKARICNKHRCSPNDCDYPQGHHERTWNAILEIASSYKSFTPEVITDYAKKYNVCPFMLETELAWFADVVICDYNYVFDPRIARKISPLFTGNDAILVDEAHNLVDRLRGINSAEIDLSVLTQIQKDNFSGALTAAASEFLKFVSDDAEDSGEACEPLSSQSLDGIERSVNALLTAFQDCFEDKKISDPNILRLSDQLKHFADLLTSRSDDYLTFYNDKGNPEIFMVNTSEDLTDASRRLGNIIMFSATLFPEEYFKFMLGAKKKDSYVSVPSPFDSNNLIVVGYPLSTKYSEREQTANEVARAIWTAGRGRTGNYMAFFPSYQYMAIVLDAFVKLFPDEKVIYQKPSMLDSERKDYISSFVSSPDKTLYAFAVLGGAFSEGIDLVGDKLYGATVVGLGSLPPSRKSALMSSYFSDMFFDGEKFVYHYPGLNKVFQACGRVIRSENDRGFLLIIDDRFFAEENIELLPESWKNVKKAKDNNDINTYICDFWQK